MDVSLTKLQQLRSVSRCGSFSRAAGELHITQPALSRSIAAIERQCGFRIFNRVGHGVQLTAAGAQLLAEAEPLLQSMRVFERNVDLIAGGTVGTLKFGLPPLLASQLLSGLAGLFFAPGNQAQLSASIRSGPALLEALKNDEIEFLVFADSQIEPCPEIDCAVIGAFSPICLVRRNHPLAGQSGLTIADLGRYPWASSVEPPAMGSMLNTARFTCDNYHILREAVLRTDLVCICSRGFVADDIADGRLSELDVPGLLPAETTVSTAKLKGRALSPLATMTVERLAALL